MGEACAPGLAFRLRTAARAYAAGTLVQEVAFMKKLLALSAVGALAPLSFSANAFGFGHMGHGGGAFGLVLLVVLVVAVAVVIKTSEKG
jgi:hypothetical protein